MKITDDTLILYYYNDGLSREEREQVAVTLAESRDLAQKYDLLFRDMESLESSVSDESAAFDSEVLRRALQNEIEVQSPPVLAHPRRWSPRFLPLAATLLVFAAGWLIGQRANDNQIDLAEKPVVAKTVESAVPSEINQVSPRFVRGIATHFESTRIQLTSMDMANPAERDELVQEIISQNRFFLKVANENGAEDVARLLRAFEPLLLSMSSGEDSGSGRSAEQFRDQLAFELDATLTKIGHSASNRRNEF